MKKISALSIATMAITSLSMAVLLTNNADLKLSKAEECNHSQIEHYSELAPTTSSLGRVEHWACCKCHTAWSDSSQTNVIGNTLTDRDNIDTYLNRILNSNPTNSSAYTDVAANLGDVPSFSSSNPNYVVRRLLDDEGNVATGARAYRTLVADYLKVDESEHESILYTIDELGTSLTTNLHFGNGSIDEKVASQPKYSGTIEAWKKQGDVADGSKRVSVTLPKINYSALGGTVTFYFAPREAVANDYPNYIYYGSTATALSGRTYVNYQYGFNVTISGGNIKLDYAGGSAKTTALTASDYNGLTGINFQFLYSEGSQWVGFVISDIKLTANYLDYKNSFNNAVSVLSASSTNREKFDNLYAALEIKEETFTAYEKDNLTDPSAIASARSAIGGTYFDKFSISAGDISISNSRYLSQYNTTQTAAHNNGGYVSGPSTNLSIDFQCVQNNSATTASSVTITLPRINYKELCVNLYFDIYADANGASPSAPEGGNGNSYDVYLKYGSNRFSMKLDHGNSTWSRVVAIEKNGDKYQAVMYYSSERGRFDLTSDNMNGVTPVEFVIDFGLTNNAESGWWQIMMSKAFVSFN